MHECTHCLLLFSVLFCSVLLPLYLLPHDTLLTCPPPIDRICRARHKARLITQQECNHLGDLGRLCCTIERLLFSAELDTPILFRRVQEWGSDDALLGTEVSVLTEDAGEE